MSRRRREQQGDAVDAAREDARRLGGHVHVFGPNEDGDCSADEAVCEEGSPPPRGALVVYHPATVQLTAGGWACSRCGEASGSAPPLAS